MNDRPASRVKIVCDQGHREVLICQLASPGFTFPAGCDVFTLSCGTLLAVPRTPTPAALRRRGAGHLPLAGANPERGGNMLRLRCPVPGCPPDVPLTWDTLARDDFARRLLDGPRRIPLAAVAAILGRSRSQQRPARR